MAKYHGGKGVLYMSTTGTGTAASIGGVSEFNSNFTRDRVEVTSFGDTTKTYVTGLKDASATFAGFYDDTVVDELYSAANSADGVKFYFYPSSDVATQYLYGSADLDFSMSQTVSDAVKVNGSLSARSGTAWTLKTT